MSQYKQPDVSVVLNALNTIKTIYYIAHGKKDVVFKKMYEFVKGMRVTDVPEAHHDHLTAVLTSIIVCIESTLDQEFKDYLAERARIRSNPEEAASVEIGAPAVYEVPITENSLSDLIERFQYHLGLIQFHFDHSGDKHLLLAYGKQAVAEQVWSDWTKICRGIVIDLQYWEVIVHPYDKFFNLNEKTFTRESVLPDLPYEDAVKEDGSMGNFYIDTEGNSRIITKGSLYGGSGYNNGEFATKILYRRYPHAVMYMRERFENYTFMFEIIYNKNHPEKIAVDYNEDDLILIGVRDLKNNELATYTQVNAIAEEMGVPAVRVENMTLEKMMEERKTRSNFEGWVRAYSNGMLIKIKCEEYLATHWARFYRSHRKLWWYMFDGSWDDLYANFNDIQKEAIAQTYQDVRGAIQSYDKKIRETYRNLPDFGPFSKKDRETNKAFASYVQEHVEHEFQQFMYQIRNGQFTSCMNTIIKWTKFRDCVLAPYIGAENIVEDEEVITGN